MFTADDYFNITNAYILNENVNHLDERKYEPDEELPSGSTPNKKMERAQGKHGANYMLTPGRGRNNPARDSHFSRGRKVKKISDIIKSGEDPRNSPQAGVGWGNDARKIGRPGVSTADRTSKTQRNDDTDAKSTYTQGGLRAHKTKAGGYRTLVKKEEYEYNELLKFLYFEGYADSYKEAECILEDMSDEEFEELCEKKLAHSFPLKPLERRSVENIKRMNDGDFSVSPGGRSSTETRSARKPDPTPTTPNTSKPKRKSEFIDRSGASDQGNRGSRRRIREEREDFDIITEFLFLEGYADTIESAELMAESISEEWVDEILDEAEKVFPLGKVADKMRKVSGEMKSSKSPEDKTKLRKRLDKMGDQYWQPN